MTVLTGGFDSGARRPGLQLDHTATPTAPTALEPLTAGSARAASVPTVSVVVPTYGQPSLLLRCLKALQSQRFPAWEFEIIVVDDARSEATRALVQLLQALAEEVPPIPLTAAAKPRQPTLHYLRPQDTRGPAAARNAGWRAARGEIVAFTDDDSVPAPDWLAQGASALRHGPWVGLSGRIVVPPLDTPPTDHERVTQGLSRAEFVTANAFVRRSALQQVGGFDERFTRAGRGDSDLQFRLDAVGLVGRCEGAVVQHPVRPERWGVSLRQQKNAFFEALLYAKHPQRYRRRRGGRPAPWDDYAIVGLTAAALVLALAGAGGSAAACALGALALVLRFAARRLRGTSHRADHVVEMLATSALIPFLSVYWRLRGALHFRVWFV